MSVKFLHLRVKDSQKGGQTIAYKVLGQSVAFSSAMCSDRDNYCRKTGRAIATGRLNAGKNTQINCDPTKPIDAILQEIGYVSNDRS